MAALPTGLPRRRRGIDVGRVNVSGEEVTMKEKGIWNAPTAEEKTIALKAKFDSTLKSLNKKGGGGGKKHVGKGGKRDGSDSKIKDDDHPKKWPASKSGEKKEATFIGHTWHWCGKDNGGKL
jgi:hypothetical protein